MCKASDLIDDNVSYNYISCETVLLLRCILQLLTREALDPLETMFHTIYVSCKVVLLLRCNLQFKTC